MKRLKNYITSLHQSTKREYLKRMNDDKISCMLEAKKYEFNYWDGIEGMDMEATNIFLVDGLVLLNS